MKHPEVTDCIDCYYLITLLPSCCNPRHTHQFFRLCHKFFVLLVAKLYHDLQTSEISCSQYCDTSTWLRVARMLFCSTLEYTSPSRKYVVLCACVYLLPSTPTLSRLSMFQHRFGDKKIKSMSMLSSRTQPSNSVVLTAWKS